MTTLDNNYNNHAFDTAFQSDFILNKLKKVVAQNSQNSHPKKIHELKKWYPKAIQNSQKRYPLTFGPPIIY